MIDPPTVIIMGSMLIEAGSNNTLECQVNSNDGGSNLNITWFKDGKVLAGENNTLLELYSIERIMDGDVYTCHVENEFGGENEDSIALTVYGMLR